jgi:phage tail-like protein
METGKRTDPFRAFNFRVEFDGLSMGSYSEVSGLTSEGDAVDYREGTDIPLTVRKLTGLRRHTQIVLKVGYTDNRELWTWYRNIVNGVADRRNGTITLLDEEHNPVLSWDVTNAWINKIEAPTFNAAGNEVAIQSVELVHEGLMLSDQPA